MRTQAAICNTLYGMLQQRQRDLEFRTSQEDTMVRIAAGLVPQARP
jgi:hypothetical protein